MTTVNISEFKMNAVSSSDTVKQCTFRDKFNKAKTWTVSYSTKAKHYTVVQSIEGFPASKAVRMSVQRINELCFDGIISIKRPSYGQRLRAQRLALKGRS